MHRQVAEFIAKRTLDSPGMKMPEIQNNMPAWAGWLFGIEALAMFPIIMWMSYSLTTLYTSLAMIEDEKSPLYTPLPTSAKDDLVDSVKNPASAPAPADVLDITPVTSSVRRVARFVRSQRGSCCPSFRGFFCLVAAATGVSVLTGLLMLWLPAFLTPFASLLAALAMAQPLAAWVHIIATPYDARPWFRRLPAFGPTLRATAQAIVVNWAATTGCLAAHEYVRDVILQCDMEAETPGAGFYMCSAMLAVAYPLLVIPTETMLVRARASLIPADKETLVNFDRSLGGRVNDASFLSVVALWKSMTPGSWKRIAKFYLRVTGVVVGISLPLALFFSIQTYLLVNKH